MAAFPWAAADRAVTMANLDKFSYIGLFSGGGAAASAVAAAAGPPGQRRPACGASAFDIKTIYSGAMADPADSTGKSKCSL